MLRRKILHDDMSQYQCFQGYYTVCCCIKGGSCNEDQCPDFCAFLEGCFCNCVAISASRTYVMEKYDLASDPCDYRLIRINNCLQILALICNIIAIIDGKFRQIARLIDHIADLFYHIISGCMTAQVAHEVNYQDSVGNQGGAVSTSTSAYVTNKDGNADYTNVGGSAPPAAYAPTYGAQPQHAYYQNQQGQPVAVAVAVPVNSQPQQQSYGNSKC